MIVIAGKNKGASGAVVTAFPKKSMVIVEGVNLVKKHLRRTAQNRKGQIIDRPMPIHASNVMLKDPKSGKGTRIKIERKDGLRTRVARASGQTFK